MKSLYKVFSVSCVFCVFSVFCVNEVSAQQTQTGYFNDGFLYRHEMNPAFGNDQNYIGFPGLGNMDVAMRGNLGVDEVLFNRGGKTVTFLHPDVTAGEFLGNVNDKNYINEELRLNILGAGFKAWGGYNTIGINLRQEANIYVPGEVFRFAKEGVTNKEYNLSGLSAEAQAFIELAFGHSRQIDEQWRLGAKLKFLLGGANITAKVNEARAVLNNNQWDIYSDAQIEASVKGLTYKTKMSEHTGNPYVNEMDVDGTGLNGFGMAVDLGAVYKLDEDWEFSAALLDLGWIGWNNNMKAAMKGDVHTDTYLFNADDNATNSFEDESDRLKDDLAKVYELKDEGDQGSRTTGIGATMNLAASYNLPAYRAMTFGLMNTTKINGDYSWTDFRLSANWAPVKAFSASASFAAGTYGASFGWILNAHPKGFNFFIGMDHTLGKLAKQGLPLSSNAHLNLGINIPF